MRDKTGRNLFSKLADESKVVCGEVLCPFLVCDFKNSDRMVAKFYWNEHNIFDNLV